MTESLAEIRAVGFDLDGTLIDTLPDLGTALNGMLARLHHAQLSEEMIRTLVGDGAESLVERALAAGRRPHAPEPSVREALTLFKGMYARRLFSRSRIYPEVIPTLRTLADAGLSLCCITNKDETLAQPLMREAALEGYFEFTIGTRTREDRKPGPAMLLRACGRLGIEPPQMLYVGDSTVDLQAARAAGCRAVAVSYGYDGRIRSGGGAPEALLAGFDEVARLAGLLQPGRTSRS
ncbi:MAG: HAD-IIIA family hydrolase [Proteobacteria bacterium]|nr:HAD-IIIA family hydrolase [Pseudomonadota bacterium]